MKTMPVRASLAALLFPVFALPAAAADHYWVSAAQADRRTCPSANCGTVGFLRHKDRVDALEVKAGWVRISAEYSAMCSGGRSDLVESGNDECVPKNGINKGAFAEWVSLQQLSKSPPAK